MIIKNLLRRKFRTLLTILGIAIGVAAIISLGGMANGLSTGYNSMLTGSKADLIISQPDAFDISYSSVDAEIGDKLLSMPEVSAVSGMLQGFTQAEGEPFFFVFGYPKDSFVLERFIIIDGVGLYSKEAEKQKGDPILLGSAAAEVLKKSPGDSLRLTGSIYRVVGIYQTGDAFEDSGALLSMQDAQILLGKQRQVSLYYIRLKDPALKDRFLERAERQWPDLSISGAEEYSQKQSMADYMDSYVWVIGGLAIVIGGVGMMNSQLMSVFERTREIGVLRAVGWSKWRILWMILAESIFVCLAGGILGTAMGWFILTGLSRVTVLFGMGNANLSVDLIIQAFTVVMILGLIGGLYPAWRASRLQPVEALRYEGGGTGKIHRLPFGGMTVQSLWQRSTRTALTLSVIGITVGAIMALDGMTRGMKSDMDSMLVGNDMQILLRQADIADTSLSAIDERIGDKIAAYSEVRTISGLIMTAIVMPDASGFFIIIGVAPNEQAIERYTIVDGKTITTNRQIIIGKFMANALHKQVNDTIDLSGSRFRITGIYESDVSWEEMGGIMTLRDAQIFAGHPRKVTMYGITLNDPSKAKEVVNKINQEFPDVHATLSGDFTNEMPDFQNMNGMMSAISMLAVLVGGVGVLNTMLMSVFERTREIGVLRALGWRRRSILKMILQESVILGIFGGVAGIIIAFLLAFVMTRLPMYGEMLKTTWEMDVFVRAILVAFSLGVLGGLYPAYRATKLLPVEALRYE
jgi:ABC-type antimicrobial peptide transport system permease subunit